MVLVVIAIATVCGLWYRGQYIIVIFFWGRGREDEGGWCEGWMWHHGIMKVSMGVMSDRPCNGWLMSEVTAQWSPPLPSLYLLYAPNL